MKHTSRCNLMPLCTSAMTTYTHIFFAEQKTNTNMAFHMFVMQVGMCHRQYFKQIYFTDACHSSHACAAM